MGVWEGEREGGLGGRKRESGGGGVWIRKRRENFSVFKVSVSLINLEARPLK